MTATEANETRKSRELASEVAESLGGLDAIAERLPFLRPFLAHRFNCFCEECAELCGVAPHAKGCRCDRCRAVAFGMMTPGEGI